MSFALSSSFKNGIIVPDPDANAYLRAVEAADGQPLEIGVAWAVNNFVVGCKEDGIWNAIKASCIMMGARTLAGALVPLVGTAPTNNNFVAADYNRKTGLKGDGSSKFILSNRNNITDPQDSRHIAVHLTDLNTSDPSVLIGTSNITGRTSIVFVGGTYTARISTSATPLTIASPALGFVGGVRTSATSAQIRVGGTSTTFNSTSEVPASEVMGVFGNSLALRSNPRLTFYSIGESLNLALLDTRITTLYNAITIAIP